MASIPLANPMNKWRLDLCGSAGSRTLMLRSAAADQSLNPPGYNPGLSTTQQSESANRAEQQQQHLLSKRAWDLALQPVKSLPMNMFMMYMAGKAPGKCVSGKCVSGKSFSLWIHKIVFALGNLCAIALAVYKCHTMGLLPNHASGSILFLLSKELNMHCLMTFNKI
ncbi:hypothetical protein niasHT_035892 [Heterodera trifolii]|uniref:ER membrane protein complex subunit 4 n=1 Tax=Heterodera trifolii TaxID=157864 RepID=A0ABD2IUR1_9BILA